MDGGTFSGLIEVSADQFRGSLMLPPFNGPKRGQPFTPKFDDGLPKGERTHWTPPGKPAYSPPVGVMIQTETGPRYWLSVSMEILTEAEALDRMAQDAAQGMRDELARMQDREARTAAAAGLTVAQYRAKRAAAESRYRRQIAAQTYQKLDEQALARINPDFEHSPRPVVRSPLARSKKG